MACDNVQSCGAGTAPADSCRRSAGYAHFLLASLASEHWRTSEGVETRRGGPAESTAEDGQSRRTKRRIGTKSRLTWQSDRLYHIEGTNALESYNDRLVTGRWISPIKHQSPMRGCVEFHGPCSLHSREARSIAGAGADSRPLPRLRGGCRTPRVARQSNFISLDAPKPGSRRHFRLTGCEAYAHPAGHPRTPGAHQSRSEPREASAHPVKEEGKEEFLKKGGNQIFQYSKRDQETLQFNRDGTPRGQGNPSRRTWRHDSFQVS